MNNTQIGNTVASAASFTTINASGNLVGQAATFTDVTATGNVTGAAATFTNLNNTQIGNTVASAASFTTINASGNLVGQAATFTNVTATGNVTGAAATFTNLNNTTIGGTSAAAASFTTINASGNLVGQAATFTNVTATGNVTGAAATFTNLNNTTIGGTSAAAASFTTINASGNLVGQAATFTTINASAAVSFASTATFTGAAHFNGAVTLGDAVGDAITSTGQFTASNGITITGANADRYLGITQISGDNTGISLVSNAAENTHTKDFISITDNNNQSGEEGFVINAGAARRAFGLNIRTFSAVGDWSNQFNGDIRDEDDILMNLRGARFTTGGVAEAGNIEGTVLNITNDVGVTPTSKFTAIKVQQGRLVWSTRTGDHDLTNHGYATVFFVNVATDVILPLNPVKGQIIYIFNVSGGAFDVPSTPAVTLAATQSVTLIYDDSGLGQWRPINTP